MLDNLVSKGDTLRAVRPVSHYLYFPSEAAAREAAATLEEEGYKTEVQPGADNKNWLTLATQDLAPTVQAIASTRSEMESLADSLGGEYDGWETEVIRLPM